MDYDNKESKYSDPKKLNAFALYNNYQTKKHLFKGNTFLNFIHPLKYSEISCLKVSVIMAQKVK